MTTLPKHLLPASLLRIADLCGDDIMWAVWEHFSGRHVYVPETVEGHPLSTKLGHSGAARLAHAFGGEILEIPRAEAARRAVRDALIRRDRATGDELAVLAVRYQLTERQVRTILSAQSCARPLRQLDVWEARDG